MARKRGAPFGSANAATNAIQAPFKSALNRAIAQDEGKRVRAAAERLLDLASNGEQWAVKELADRLDGKATQVIAGADGGPVQVETIRRVVVDPKA